MKKKFVIFFFFFGSHSSAVTRSLDCHSCDYDQVNGCILQTGRIELFFYKGLKLHKTKGR